MKTHAHLLLLMLWVVIGTSLRFFDLDSLPPWTDECATMVFSLGNSFRTVPLNQLISADILLQPLQLTSVTGISTVMQNLLQDSTHPPVYFVLAHVWMKLFSPVGEVASIFTARSLSALLGVISIPAMFCFGYLTFRSKLVGQLAAAMMAVSPYTIFLAREARHYSLVMLLVIASLCCLITAMEKIRRQQSLPIWLLLTWIVINCLGVATHYFFMLTLGAEGVVVLRQVLLLKNQQINWWRLGIVALGTAIGCLVWIPNLQNIPGNDLTSWVAASSPHSRWLEPLARLLLWLMSMLLLLPSALTTLPLTVIIISGVVTLVFLLWSLPQIIHGLKSYQSDADKNPTLQILIDYVLAAIALTLLLTYGLGKDLTLAARFQFFYAPAVILLLGVALAGCWHQVAKSGLFTHGKVAVSVILLMATLGGVIVTGNWGYLQNQRPDVLAAIIEKASGNNVLIATTHIHHGQTGRMMGLAWELQNQPNQNLQFFLAAQDPNTHTYTQSQQILVQKLTQVPRPLDLWLVEYRNPVDLVSQNCTLDKQYGSFAGEYSYKLYRCLASETSS
ncbi:glycosyltransferase family 39 protein [Nostoc sp. CMAA1605]|uniref:glycosyltransferase family 39 protein n=1 Tax=Nostoc sp. CMAA1605 TaxID=2055159 RepID=UPI001F2DFFE3|nr:glycosyltransferase family 39 protein [Nostoc sp. CMAA1605]MCF4966253.1 hypothetical protein [Nostoc sp. CMAA1605]